MTDFKLPEGVPILVRVPIPLPEPVEVGYTIEMATKNYYYEVRVIKSPEFYSALSKKTDRMYCDDYISFSNIEDIKAVYALLANVLDNETSQD